MVSNTSEFTCHHVDSYYSTPEFLSLAVHVVTAVSIPTHILGLYIILTKTPSYMNSVKWYFLNLHIWIIIYDNFLGVLTIPYVILPTWSGYTLGLLRHLGVSDITMNVLIVLACTSKFNSFTRKFEIITQISYTLLSILAIFEHRFHIVCTYSWKSKWERYRHFWLGAHYVYAVLVFIPFWFLVPEQIEAKKHVFEKIPCLPVSVRSGPIFVVTEDFTYHLTSLVVFLLIGMIEFFGFMLCLVWNILQRVRSKRMSQKTYEVHVKFFIALLIQTGIPTVMLLIPLTYAWVSILYNYYDQSFTNGVIIFETLHGLCSTLVMIFIHAPYRQALFAMVFRCYMRSDAPKVRVQWHRHQITMFRISLNRDLFLPNN